MEDIFICAICIEIANDAVESRCCHQIFCHDCIAMLKVEKCPMCRATYPKYAVDVSYLARRIIGGMEMTCIFECGSTFPRSERNGHELKCINKPYTCPAMGCMFQGNRVTYLTHLVSVHDSTLIHNSSRLFEGATGSDAEIDRIKTTVNFKKNIARLGSTGKYYCKQALDGPSCLCCNAYCGPTNGCNCSACMKLDVYSQKLPQHWFVNTDGAPCRKGTTGQHYCGRRVLTYNPSADGYCGPTNGDNCPACSKIDDQYNNRYANVWS